ncbi:hypothetical protein J7T55_003011 [Diaporthe amygdali]|uniref:uncharacterized protein n=1 Tax=Phomopsis amygdali TaxID=1214568 RepID=UPI0022FDBA4D|nr:uncharacterized protein J7T55_003011 [Diaporthe amygdali]KAJ0122498.1 hypothetical protein J7T55_003011 [Diaporthe amygdali]
MDSRDFSFGMNYNSRSPHEQGFHFNPLSAQSGSSLQPEPDFAAAPTIFRSSNGPYQHQPEDQAAHQEDLQMMDDGLMELPLPSVELPTGVPNQVARKSHRSKYAQLDWDTHKHHIQKLYFENKTLKQIRETMVRDHAFNASDKLYKNKFSEWRWQKNLSADTALFMVQKAKQRKRNFGKDTTFHYGGREWPLQKAETTVSRSKRQRDEDHMIIVETPQGMTYETPAALVLSPEKSHLYNEKDENDRSDANSISDTDSEASGGENMLRLTWEGHTGPEFLTLWKLALQYRDEGKVNEAEYHLERVWTGLRHISGVTNEDTNKVAYSLANLYADTGRMDKAVGLVERVIQDHVKILGYESKITQQRVLLAAEILNGWNRHAEALGMLSRSNELLGTSGLDQRRSPRKAKTRRHAREKERSTGADEVSQILATEFNDSDPDKISWALTVARRQVLARSENAEMLLRAIITHCEIYPNENLRQHLVARGELLALYEKLDVADQRVAAFESAMNALKQTWDLVDWDEDRLEHFEIMEASLQLIANMLKSGYKNEARRFFEEAVELAAKTFGTTDERTIWILITIGIVVQTHMGWSDARDWFEQAFAAALDEWGPDPKEGIVKSLQVALDREHFSYVSDEGRPYKTVFGVSGIRIMPGRLHLE